MYFVCVLFFTYVIDTTTADRLNPRSVNLNLETVLQFDPKDNSGDVKFIDHIQKFLGALYFDIVSNVMFMRLNNKHGKVKTVIDNKPSRRSQRTQEAIKFTDFIKNVIIILKTYSDDDLQDVISVIDNELRKYHYKGCKFHELIQNDDLRRYVASKLSTIQNQDGKNIKKTLNNVLDALDDAKYDYKHTELLDYVNSLYRYNDYNKMKNFLSLMKAYGVKSKRANLDLIRIVRNGIRGLIFDHYSNLNRNARRQLRLKIESFWHREKVVTTTEATTTKKKFDIANGFNFLRDFTFEFIKPETTKYTEYAKKSTETSHSTEAFVDGTRQKKNKSPEDMPDYTDSEETKEKTTTEKPKKKKGKKDKHKMKKENKRNKAHVTIADENLAPERKRKSKKHKDDFEFRQSEARTVNMFDYKAVIDVRGQTDESESNSNEVWNPNYSISSDSRSKKRKKKFNIRDFRKNIAPVSEEGLSIDFRPPPINLSRHTERTTKHDDTILRRLNNLEKVYETFKSKVTEDINVTPNKIKLKSTTHQATEIIQSAATERRSPAALAFVQNTATIPFWQKLSQKILDYETGNTKMFKPIKNIQDSTTETIPTEERETQQSTIIETTPTWKQQSYEPSINYEKSEITTEEIYSTTPKIENQSQIHDITNTTDENDITSTQNYIKDIIQRAVNLPNTNNTNSENEIDNVNNFDKVIGKYNLSKDLLEDFKEKMSNITIMTTNDIPVQFRTDKGEKAKENNKDSSEVNSSKDIKKTITDISEENDIQMETIRSKLRKDINSISPKGDKKSNFLMHEFDL